MKILHCEQPLGTHRPGSAPVTLLTDSSVSRNHRPLFLPPHSDSWVITISPAVRISRLGKFVAPKFASRYYDAVTLVARLRPAGDLHLPASAIDTAFDSSIVTGDWIEFDGTARQSLPLSIDGDISHSINLDLDIVNDTVAWLSSYFMIKHGDIIIPGDLPDRLPARIDSALKISLNDTNCLDFRIK